MRTVVLIYEIKIN